LTIKGIVVKLPVKYLPKEWLGIAILSDRPTVNPNKNHNFNNINHLNRFKKRYEYQ